MNERKVEELLGRPITDQERDAIVLPLLGRGVSPGGVADALRATEKPKRPAKDSELRTIRYEALGDSLRRIPEGAAEDQGA